MSSNSKKILKVLVVGGVAGGGAVATKLRRLDETAEIIMFEKGEYVAFANCGLPYHVGKTIPNRDSLLVVQPSLLRQRFNIDVRLSSEVLNIDKDAKTVTVVDTSNGERREYTETYDKLVVAVGGKSIVPPMELHDIEISTHATDGVYTLQTLPDMDKIKKIADNNDAKSVVVIGAGFIGLEIAEEVHRRNKKVTIIELANQVFAPLDKEMSTPLLNELQNNGIDVKLGTSITKIAKNPDATLTLTTTNGETLTTDMVVLAIGVVPNTDLAQKAGLKLGDTGAIAVDEQMRTSDKNIFAVGDAVEVHHIVSNTKVRLPLAGNAAKQGRIAANTIFGRESKFGGAIGTSVCKVLDYTAAVVGINEKTATKAGIPYKTAYAHPASHASYYPGSESITMKLLYNPDNGRILGMQAVGKHGVDKRIDVIAVAIKAGMSVFDLEEMELAYAPPYGSTRDANNMLGLIASDEMRGDVVHCSYNDINTPNKNQVIIDTRTPSEYDDGHIHNSINIPVDELRGKLGDLDKNTEYLLYCRVGLRGYIASRILMNNGFKCKNFSGGYLRYILHK